MKTLNRKPPRRRYYLFLTECDYCTEKESQRFRQTAAAYRSLPAPRMKGSGWLFGKNSMAVLLVHRETFSGNRGKKEDPAFMGALYQSLGAAYAQMFQFHRAYRAYDNTV